jgi:hypothetical protein
MQPGLIPRVHLEGVPFIEYPPSTILTPPLIFDVGTASKITLFRILGKGAFATVFEAQQLLHKESKTRNVAVKLITLASEEDEVAIIEEARRACSGSVYVSHVCSFAVYVNSMATPGFFSCWKTHL